MPCMVTPEEARWYEEQSNTKEFGLAVDDVALVSTVACSACRELEAKGLLSAQPKYVRVWWEKHKKEDAEREAGSKKKKRYNGEF